MNYKLLDRLKWAVAVPLGVLFDSRLDYNDKILYGFLGAMASSIGKFGFRESNACSILQITKRELYDSFNTLQQFGYVFKSRPHETGNIFNLKLPYDKEFSKIPEGQNYAFCVKIPMIVLVNKQLSINEKIFLIHVMSYINRFGKCFSSVGFLSKITGLEKHDIYNIIENLCYDGYLKLEVIKDKGSFLLAKTRITFSFDKKRINSFFDNFRESIYAHTCKIIK